MEPAVEGMAEQLLRNHRKPESGSRFPQDVEEASKEVHSALNGQETSATQRHQAKDHYPHSSDENTRLIQSHTASERGTRSMSTDRPPHHTACPPHTR